MQQQQRRRRSAAPPSERAKPTIIISPPVPDTTNTQRKKQKQISRAHFLGPYLPPQGLTLAAISAPPPAGAYASAIVSTNLVDAAMLAAVSARREFLNFFVQ